MRWLILYIVKNLYKLRWNADKRQFWILQQEDDEDGYSEENEGDDWEWDYGEQWDEGDEQGEGEEQRNSQEGKGEESQPLIGEDPGEETEEKEVQWNLLNATLAFVFKLYKLYWMQYESIRLASSN